MYVCMYVYFNSVVHYTSYVNNVRQIQTHPESRPTTESLKDCGWVISNSGWPNKPSPVSSSLTFSRISLLEHGAITKEERSRIIMYFVELSDSGSHQIATSWTS